MNHVAIDLGSKESQVCVRTADGSIVFEKKHPTRRLEQLMAGWEPSRVIVETSSEAFRVADAARRAGHEVRVVPSSLAPQLGVGERGVKTDERDARKLSEVSCRIDLPSVHIPSEEARTLRSVIRSREILLEMRTKLVSHVRGWLRTQLWKLSRGSTATLPERIRAETTVPDHVEQVLVMIDALNVQMRQADQRVKALALANPICQRLMTIPGIGPITAVTFVAVIDDVTRFAHAYRVASYLGLTPGENSSSDRQQRTSITKAGPSSMRRTLIQAAWVLFRRYPNDPMTKWAMSIAERRGKPIAVVALARKMSCVMYALWRDQTNYKPTHSPRNTN